MGEDEGLAGARGDLDRGLGASVELGLAAGAGLVEVENQGQKAALLRGAVERAVAVPVKLLASLVAVEAKALVEAAGLHAGEVRGEQRLEPAPQLPGQGRIVEDHPGVVPDLGRHQEPVGTDGDRGLGEAAGLGLVDQRCALVGREGSAQREKLRGGGEGAQPLVSHEPSMSHT
jgi:hypothetical protein